MDDRNEPSWYDGDHLEGGATFLDQVGHSRDSYWNASAGTNDEGHPQVLVLGFNNIQLINHEGETVLDVGSRDIRALRAVGNDGLQICTTRNMSTESFQTRWSHHVAAADAEYLENLWLILPPVNHDGIQLNALPWREDEYAYYVGRVVTESAKCDVALAGVAMMVYSMLGWSPNVLQGKSGNELADALAEIGKYSATFADLGERYGAWYIKRNFATHGIRPSGPNGHPSTHVFKHRPGKKHFGVRPEVEEQDFHQLALIWRAFYALNHDAFHASMHINFFNPETESAEGYIARTPPANTVADDERLPKP